MAYYSIQELSDKTAEQISELINCGFRIDGKESVQKHKSMFKAVLKHSGTQSIVVTFRTLTMGDRFAKVVYVECPEFPLFNKHACYNYYKVRDNIYTDCLADIR